jgi:hypothetical protein
MALRGWKGLALVGLLGVAAGCNERQDAKVRENARQVGREVGEAAQDVKEAGKDAAKELEQTGHEAAEGLREGYGGSGQEHDQRDGVDIGRNPGVINDGEGPLENGRGPLEEGSLQPGRDTDTKR